MVTHNHPRNHESQPELGARWFRKRMKQIHALVEKAIKEKSFKLGCGMLWMGWSSNSWTYWICIIRKVEMDE